MLELVNEREADVITHAGTMHADDVFTTAFLLLYFDNLKVARVNEVVNTKAIVFDIGYGKFDHHQEDARVRENGIKYASFGLIFEEYGKKYLKKINVSDIDLVYEEFINDFVLGIDAIDNGIFPKIEASYKVKTTSDIIKLLNPAYKSNKNIDEQFYKAVMLAKSILEEEFSYVIGKVKAKVKVSEQLEKCVSNTLFLDEAMPYEEILLNSDKSEMIDYVVFPSNRGGYVIKVVPVSYQDRSLKKPFPRAWGSKTNDELEEASGIKGMKFCHTNLFILTVDSMETVLKVLEVLKDQE